MTRRDTSRRATPIGSLFLSVPCKSSVSTNAFRNVTNVTAGLRVLSAAAPTFRDQPEDRPGTGALAGGRRSCDGIVTGALLRRGICGLRVFQLVSEPDVERCRIVLRGDDRPRRSISR